MKLFLRARGSSLAEPVFSASYTRTNVAMKEITTQTNNLNGPPVTRTPAVKDKITALDTLNGAMQY